MTYNYSFGDVTKPEFVFDHIGRDLISDGFGGTRFSANVNTGHWQALENVPHVESVEMRNVLIEYSIPQDQTMASIELHPNMPWAEEEFQNRVSGEPLNPHPSVVRWPWYDPEWAASQGGQYSHTYAERYWPKWAGPAYEEMKDSKSVAWEPTFGVRYHSGDLQDVVSLLAKHPGTRQAYLPVWFPEDTGAVHGERVPCSLGYHWLLRDGRLHCNYFIRSCDFLRYLRDDLYLTCRLTQWVCDQLTPGEGRVGALIDDEELQHLRPGDLTMFIGSLHIFEGDLPKMRRLYG